MNNPDQRKLSKRIHGGPDREGVPTYDFSSNANGMGTPDFILNAIQQASFRYYPDPEYFKLRQCLATKHQVDPERVLIAGSASEFIYRITSYIARGILCNTQNASPTVWFPEHCYGDYQNAAATWQLVSTKMIMEADLVWLCDPSSPLGRPLENINNLIASLSHKQIAVLDLAYEPLRLEGHLALNQSELDLVWQMWSPNKALGITGIRGAYIIGPSNSQRIIQELNSMASSWVLGAHGVEMLSIWADSRSKDWLNQSLEILRNWKLSQIEVCNQIGWLPLHSVSNFFCVNPQRKNLSDYQSQLRKHGIKLRDTSSFGLPNHFRLAVMSPATQSILLNVALSMGKE